MYKIQVNTKEELNTRIMHVGAIIKEEQNTRNRVTLSIDRKVIKCFGASGWVFGYLL